MSSLRLLISLAVLTGCSGSTKIPTETLVTGQAGPRALIVDETHVYWSNRDGQLARAPKAGGAPEVLTKLSHEATELAADESNLYFASPLGKVIGWVPKTGGEPMVAPQPGALGIGVDNDFIYWSTGQETLRLAKGGGGGEARVLEKEQPALGPIAIDSAGVYVLTGNGAVVRSLRNGGSSLIRPAEGQGRGIAQDATNIYVTLQRTVVRIPKAGGEQQTVARGDSPPGRVTADDKFIYWPSEGYILTLSTQGYDQVEQVVADQGDIGGLFTDSTHIYWSASDSGEIRRVRKPFDSDLNWKEPWKISSL